MCPDCEARRKLARDALLRAAVGEAVTHVVKGATEAIGLRKKTGEAELREKSAQDSQAIEKPGAAGKRPAKGKPEQEQQP